MKLTDFEKLIKNNNACPLSEEYILFNDLELYSFKTEESKFFKSLNEVYEYEIGGKKIRDIVLGTETFKFALNGGRGSGSGNSNEMGGGFNHAPRGRGKDDIGKVKFPAEFNRQGRFTSYKGALKLFRDKYADADHEYGITVDDNGFVHKHIEGGTSAVAISGNKGEVVIHNHPSGGNFSDADLLSVSATQEKGIVAVGSKYTYSFMKKKGFKSKEFTKAVKKAKWPANLDYSEGADWWLRKNAKTYGYEYTRRKA